MTRNTCVVTQHRLEGENKITVRYSPQAAVIRVILDNHSAHLSKETFTFLATRPGRFVYVHTPRHGSWLNLIGAVFFKMARTFLRHIRVASKDGLKKRIARGIAEMNAAPSSSVSVISTWPPNEYMLVNRYTSESIALNFLKHGRIKINRVIRS